MSQISRLHATEIANGNLIDATHINNELNQLVTESNSQDTRLNTAEGNVTTLYNTAQSAIQGLLVQYSTSNRVLIKPGQCRDATNTELMQVTSDLTVDISVNGANGLDTGSEANSTWYYVWLIKNPSTSTVAGLLSTSSTSPTMPSGYTKKRLLPIAVRNDTIGNLTPFYIGSGWPQRPFIGYNVNIGDNGAVGANNVLNNGTATTFTDVALSSFVPPISKLAELKVEGVYSSTPRSVYVRANGESHFGEQIRVTASGGIVFLKTLMPTDGSQIVEYQLDGTGSSAYLWVTGYVVTEV